MANEMPATRRVGVVDEYHGTSVPDPYRWLEDGDAPDVVSWVTAQNRFTADLLTARPDRAHWHGLLDAAHHRPEIRGAQLRGEVLVVLEREAGADQARLVARPRRDPVSSVVVLADPAAGADDHAVNVDWFHPSPDGALVAYGVSDGGTENSTLHVARTSDGADLGERIPDCRFATVGWEPDNSGFFYTRHPAGNPYDRAVYHHTIGAPWEGDPVVWDDRPTRETIPQVAISSDGEWVLVSASVGWARTDVHLLHRPSGAWTEVVTGVDAVTSMCFDGDRLLGRTTLDAPRGRIVAAALAAPREWITLVPEREGVAGMPHPLPDGFLVSSSHLGVDTLERRSSDGSTSTVIGGLGVVSVVELDTDRSTGAAVALVTDFCTPPHLAAIADDVAAVLHPTFDDLPELVTSQLEYPSTDGTPIPIFLVHRADVAPGPDTPTILFGYGGFGITMAPGYNPITTAWCAAGGLYAVAGLRGGNERGEAWHDAGKRGAKQQVFDDYCAAADWLVATGRTTRRRLALYGRSNGGLLVGAALTQRPEVARAVWCGVPLLDMVRFPRFLMARLWTDEYGDPDVPEEFEWLWGYSPYHHVREGESYPAVIITTAEGDTRVDPLHARKMVALLQHASADVSGRPVLLRQDGRSGHGVGKPVTMQVDEHTDVLTFLAWQLGM